MSIPPRPDTKHAVILDGPGPAEALQIRRLPVPVPAPGRDPDRIASALDIPPVWVISSLVDSARIGPCQPTFLRRSPISLRTRSPPRHHLLSRCRAVDVRNPFEPTEVAYYVPAPIPNTDQCCVTVDGVESCRTAIQTNNVEVDDRGLIYLVDRANSGLYIVELTGPAAALINE